MSASLPMHDFETSCTSHSKNISSLNCKDLLNINAFHYSISKMNAKYPQLTKCQHFPKKRSGSKFLIFLLLRSTIWLGSTLTDSVFKFSYLAHHWFFFKDVHNSFIHYVKKLETTPNPRINNRTKQSLLYQCTKYSVPTLIFFKVVFKDHHWFLH